MDSVDLEELKEQLRDVMNPDQGVTYKKLWDMLYYIRLLKYVRQPQLVQIDKRFQKICSAKKLAEYERLDLIRRTANGSIVATDKSLQFLKLLKYPYKTLPKTVSGEGDVNEINNTEVLIQALKLEGFKTLLYPRFPYDNPTLIPDALLVLQREGGYKLTFLEIESSKPNWDEWVENKREKYLRLSGSRQVYDYWKIQAGYLDMPAPEIKDFKFSVTFVGKINKDFGPGFNFKENING